MTPTESDSKKQSQEEKRFSPEVNMERPKRSKRSTVNSPKSRSTVREFLTSFEEEPTTALNVMLIKINSIWDFLIWAISYGHSISLRSQQLKVWVQHIFQSCSSHRRQQINNLSWFFRRNIFVHSSLSYVESLQLYSEIQCDAVQCGCTNPVTGAPADPARQFKVAAKDVMVYSGIKVRNKGFEFQVILIIEFSVSYPKWKCSQDVRNGYCWCWWPSLRCLWKLYDGPMWNDWLLLRKQRRYVVI